MPLRPSSQNQSSRTLGNCYFLIAVLLVILAFALALLIVHGVHANHRDEASLKWPKTSGKIVQCEQGSGHTSKNTYYFVTITYTYILNGQRYGQNRYALWNSVFIGDNKKTLAFIAAHPASSPIDVYYDPQDPHNAVLVPGPDEQGNRMSIGIGVMIIIFGIVVIVVLGAKIADLKTNPPSVEALASLPDPVNAAVTPFWVKAALALFLLIVVFIAGKFIWPSIQSLQK